MNARILACDLRPVDTGIEVAFGRDDAITGTLHGVSHAGAFGMTSLAVSGQIYDVDADTLVRIPTDAALRIGAEPGRMGVWERANHAATMQLLVHGEVTGVDR